MEDELLKLQHEEESLRLALKLDEKRQTVQQLRAVIDGSHHRTPNEVPGVDHPSPGTRVAYPRVDQHRPSVGAADPQIYLEGKVSSVKYRKIIDYLPQRCRNTDEEIKCVLWVLIVMDDNLIITFHNKSIQPN